MIHTYFKPVIITGNKNYLNHAGECTTTESPCKFVIVVLQELNLQRPSTKTNLCAFDHCHKQHACFFCSISLTYAFSRLESTKN